MSIPTEALSQHLAILGKTGSGKTTAAKGAVESLLRADKRVCAIDPTGAWYGLRLGGDGHSAGFPVVVFGGSHADVDLSEMGGAKLAEIIAGGTFSAIIDTSLMTVGARTRFFTDFAEALFRANRRPLHLVIDEAHLFAPQGRVPDPASGRMVHAANNLVSGGRSRGLRIMLISQRPAKLHKDSLTQVQTLIAMRLIAPQDRAAIEDWIGEWTDAKQGREVIASLPSLAIGEGWVWAPELGILERRTFPSILTFDSSRAPEDGLEPVLPASLGDIDIHAITAALAQEPAVAPARMAKTIGITSNGLEAAKAEAYAAGLREGIGRGWDAAVSDMASTIEGLVGKLRSRRETIAANGLPPMDGLPVVRKKEITADAPASRRTREAEASTDDTREPLTVYAKALLGDACRLHPVRLSWAQLATIGGRKARGGAFNHARRQLLDRALLVEGNGLASPTPEGFSAVGVSPAGGGHDMAAVWLKALPQPANRMFGELLKHPRGLAASALGTALGMVPRGGRWNDGIATLRRNDLIEKTGDLMVVRKSARA